MSNLNMQRVLETLVNIKNEIDYAIKKYNDLANNHNVQVKLEVRDVYFLSNKEEKEDESSDEILNKEEEFESSDEWSSSSSYCS